MEDPVQTSSPESFHCSSEQQVLSAGDIDFSPSVWHCNNHRFVQEVTSCWLWLLTGYVWFWTGRFLHLSGRESKQRAFNAAICRFEKEDNSKPRFHKTWWKARAWRSKKVYWESFSLKGNTYAPWWLQWPVHKQNCCIFTKKVKKWNHISPQSKHMMLLNPRL